MKTKLNIIGLRDLYFPPSFMFYTTWRRPEEARVRILIVEGTAGVAKCAMFIFEVGVLSVLVGLPFTVFVVQSNRCIGVVLAKF